MPTLQEGSTGSVANSLADIAHQWRAEAVEHKAARDRRQFRAAYESVRCGVSGLGPRRAGRGCRRPDLGCFLACGERHAGNSGRLAVRCRFIPRCERGLKQVRRGGRLYNPRLCCGAAR